MMGEEELVKVASASMLIRKPLAEVFEAFINPEITTKFWFTQSSGKLEEGASIKWIWEMYNLTVPVFVKSIEPHESILIEWGEGDDLSQAQWTFRSLAEEKTYVGISNFNFLGSDHEVVNKVIDSTGGFTMVLAGLKAWLEHGIELGLIGDKFPPELMQQ